MRRRSVVQQHRPWCQSWRRSRAALWTVVSVECGRLHAECGRLHAGGYVAHSRTRVP